MAVEAVLRRALAAALLVAAPVAQPQPAAPPAQQLQLCMACHGPQGNSQNPEIPSLAAQPQLFIENQLVLIREGMREVPQMKGLLDGMKDQEIVALASYFTAQKPVAAAGKRDEAMFQRGQALSTRALCSTCHLPDFSGRQQIPRLAGQHEAFLLAAMKQFRDRPGPGRDTIMAASLYGLKDQDLADLAHYLAQLR